MICSFLYKVKFSFHMWLILGTGFPNTCSATSFQLTFPYYRGQKAKQCVSQTPLQQDSECDLNYANQTYFITASTLDTHHGPPI